MDIALRFKSMEKAMTDVVIPALEGSNALAVEQAYFVLFHLRLIGKQFDKDLHLKLAELRDIAGYVAQLVELLGGRAPSGAGQAISRAQAALENSEPARRLILPTRAAVTEMVVELKTAADALLRVALQDADSAVRQNASEITLRYSDRDVIRRRVWVKDAGYDLETTDLPAIEQVLGMSAS